jgi:hypothetical protein
MASFAELGKLMWEKAYRSDITKSAWNFAGKPRSSAVFLTPTNTVDIGWLGLVACCCGIAGYELWDE